MIELKEPVIHLQIHQHEINYAELTESVRNHRCGAVLLFLGTVREFTSGKQTSSLSYEAYEPLAIAELNRLVQEAMSQWPLAAVSIEHRIGDLELGDIAVAIAVSTPHRKEAYESGQWLMEQIKKSVPIWKREHWTDGTQEWIHPQQSSQ